MSDTINLGVERAAKSGDNRHYQPKEMLEQCAIESVEDGVESALGILVQRDSDGKINDISFRASNLSRMEILAVAEQLKFLVMS